MNSVAKAIIATWSSRKLWMTLIAAAMLYSVYHIANAWLCYYASAPEQNVPHAEAAITAGVTLFQIFFYGFCGIVAAYVGATGLVEMRQGSAVQTALETVTHSVKESRTDRIIQDYAEKYKDDPSYRPIEKETFR